MKMCNYVKRELVNSKGVLLFWNVLEIDSSHAFSNSRDFQQLSKLLIDETAQHEFPKNNCGTHDQQVCWSSMNWASNTHSGASQLFQLAVSQCALHTHTPMCSYTEETHSHKYTTQATFLSARCERICGKWKLSVDSQFSILRAVSHNRERESPYTHREKDRERDKHTQKW